MTQQLQLMQMYRYPWKIKSTTLCRSFMAKKRVCCKSHNIIYYPSFTVCGLQYVGQTRQTPPNYLYEHFSDINKNDLTMPPGRHFTMANHNKDPWLMKVHILAFITKSRDTSAALEMRLKFELDWIFRLRTNLLHGLNAMDLTTNHSLPLPFSTF